MKQFRALSLLLAFLPIFALTVVASENPTDANRSKESDEKLLLLPWYMEQMYTATPPLSTELIDGKVIITEILHKALIDQGLKVGMEISQINGMNVIMYADKHILPYITYETKEEMVSMVYGQNLLAGYVNEPILLKMNNGQLYPVKRLYPDAFDDLNPSGATIIIEKEK